MSRPFCRPVDIVRSLRRALLFTGFLVAAISSSFSQEISQVQSSPVQLDPPPTPTPSSGTSSYAFPDGKQQFRNYLSSAIGPVAFVRAAIGAGMDQGKPAPPEWDTGVEGFGERYGFRFGMGLITESYKYSSGALLHEDVAYHRCSCVGFVPRTVHAFVSPFTARSRSGSTILSIPSITAPYAGAFAATNAWYPSRYEPQDAARLGSYSFALSMGVSLVREFVLRTR